MRLPNAAHTSRPWRIHELTRDFRLEDVWALPTPGGPDDFPRLVQMIASGDPSQRSLARRPHAVGDPLEARGAARLGRPGRRPRLAGCRRSATVCQRICATRHPGRISARFPSARCICSTTSGRRRSPTRRCTGSCTSAGSRTGPAATAARWPFWSSQTGCSGRLHGRDQAVPPPDRLPADDSANRADLAGWSRRADTSARIAVT